VFADVSYVAALQDVHSPVWAGARLAVGLVVEAYHVVTSLAINDVQIIVGSNSIHEV
jgi:ribosomal protein L30E